MMEERCEVKRREGAEMEGRAPSRSENEDKKRSGSGGKDMRRGVEMKYMITILCDLISTNYSL
jgi:hypothetical protein